MKQIALKEIIDFLENDIKKIYGNPEKIFIKYLKPPETVDVYTLDWINSTLLNKQQIAEQTKASAIICDASVCYSEILKSERKVIIQVENPKLCIVRIGHNFFTKLPESGIHPSAFIHPSAILGNNIFIGANTTIGECRIGDNVYIYPNVVVNDDVYIGNNVIVKPGSILGFDGFGYERDESNNLIKFPQLGKLIIKDKVEIGSNTCIDKGSLSDTIIGFNTKINNLCHIAHNVEIGSNVIITAHVNISGSTVIEDDVWIAPNSSLRGHQIIGKKAIIGMGAVVTKNVPAGETWIGNPAKKK